MSIVGGTVRTGLWGLSLPARGVAAAADSLRDLDRQARAQLAVVASRVERIVIEAIDTDGARDGLVRVLESDGVERLLDRVLASPGSERLVAQIVDSPVVQETVTRLLESEQLWILVDEIARSPAVTEAISSQSLSFADQMTDRVRDRSRDADAWVERAARRVVRRSPKRARAN